MGQDSLKKKAKKKPAKKLKKRGRKTYYRKSYCQKIIDFFDIEPYEDKELPHYKGKGDDRILVWTDYKRMANRLPTLRNFAKSIGVSTVTVYAWPKKHEEFLNAFTHAQELRKWFIIENGLNSCYNPLFAKFTAINITNMVDKQEVTGKDGEPLMPIQVIIKNDKVQE